MEATNTIVVCELPRESVKDAAEAIAALALPGIEQVAQINFMCRVLAVFDSPLSAERALPVIHSAVHALPGCPNAHAGFSLGDTPSVPPGAELLQLPNPGKLLFISPPPSPPSEWEDQPEEAPNKQVHYEQELNEKLFLALSKEQITISPERNNLPAITLTGAGVSSD